MTSPVHPSALWLLIIRWPHVSLSVVAHAVLLALLYYYFGSYRVELLEQQAEVASSLRATHVASTAKRLQDLETIKKLLEKSADRDETVAEPPPTPLAPETPGEMVARARELSEEIDALDQEIQAKELAELMAELEPTPTTEAPPHENRPAPAEEKKTASDNAALEPRLTANAENASGDTGQRGDTGGANSNNADVTEEMAASEVAALETMARDTLLKHQRRLEAKANGVPIQGRESRASQAGPGAGADESVRKEIADFIFATDPREHKASTNKYGGRHDFFDRGATVIPPVDAASLVIGHGRMIGAGGEYANRVYLNSWYIIGPFPGRHAAGLFENNSHPPEKAVLLDAVYYGKDERLLRWQYVTAQSYPLVPPDSAEDSVYYGYTEVFVDEACDLTAWIGADDDVQIYVNDRMVWRGGNVDKQSYFMAVFDTRTTHLRDYNRTEGKRVVHFNKGRNKIFFKLSNGPNNAFLSLVLTR